ncbi:energy transducer TonB [Campylobacter sp. LR291e]|uniref:energy transducer TonB n=1 Tax=unclassified Campylobacter TaxID=2593542 RepID=UPI001237AD0E|nr:MULTISPECIES: energy transducer TonB [unclassified Campylobacter]KAA6224877.1 energy transducer TonB [Campylobacter sp. LR185c]KAA6230267.1 energy transducer TonB [Campylobacter sp. LR291e]KAA8604198.1 hypothetical protein CGP82_03140 [Campylobacter sp. LR185c]
MHKIQAFIITCIVFLPLYVSYFYVDIFKVQNSFKQSIITLSFKNFASNENSENLEQKSLENQNLEENLVEEKEKVIEKKRRKKPEKIVKNDPKKIKQKINQALISPNSQNTSINNNYGALASVGQGGGEGDSGEYDNFLSQVKSIINKTAKKHYPKEAINAKITGLVRVQFSLVNNELKDLKIISSSNYKILDNNSLQVIKKASKYFPKYHKNVVLSIELAYKLK